MGIAFAGKMLTIFIFYEIILSASNQFHHANIKMPDNVNSVLEKFIVTPKYHTNHHTVKKDSRTNAKNHEQLTKHKEHLGLLSFSVFFLVFLAVCSKTVSLTLSTKMIWCAQRITLLYIHKFFQLPTDF